MEKKKEPKISVIISTYNREKYIGHAIDSVLNQTYKNVEIIVIDDCSTDNTEEYLKKYKNKLRYYKNEVNCGCGISRKRGMEYAQGDYIIFLDDDDKYICNKYFEEAINILEKDKKIGLVAAAHYVRFTEGNKLEEKKFPYKKIVNNVDMFTHFASPEYPKPIASIAIIRRKALEFAKYQDMKILNDTTIYLRALLYGPMGFINKPYLEYLVHGANISFNLKIDFLIDNLEEKYNVYLMAKDLKDFKKIDFNKWLDEQLDITIIYYIRGSKPSWFNYRKIIKWYKKHFNNKEKLKYFKSVYKESKKKEKTI